MEFSYAILWKNPLKTLSFAALMMSYASLWIHRSVWIWGSFLGVATILGFQTGIVTPLALVPILFLLTIYFFLFRKNIQGLYQNQSWNWNFCSRFFCLIKRGVRCDLPASSRERTQNQTEKDSCKNSNSMTDSGILRALLIFAAGAISIGLWFHLVPGFNNWQLVNREILSKEAVPYSLWLNFDKSLIGIFILAWSLPLIKTKEKLWNVAKKALPFFLLGIGIMILLALYGGVVKWDPKILSFFSIWVLSNLLLTVIPEEAFCRGFIQEEIYHYLHKRHLPANAGAVILTSLLFMLLHICWIKNVPFLSLAFISGIIYGSIYQYTKSIESAIFCHFLFNGIHFIFFTYPALVK
ncbi:MAG: type II CAAX endopeptidase family protein [Chlamydiota bacterium]